MNQEENTGNEQRIGYKNPPKERRFKPGESGNPHGRPKKLPALDKLLPEVLGDEADNNSEITKILKTLVKRAKNKGGDRAAEILLDRAYGKAKQINEVIGDVTVVVRHE